jgi:hypothetical protein
MMLLLGTGSALADSCTDLAPLTLRMQLESRFPGFAFPHEYDNAPADVALHHDRSGSSCLGVVQEDLDGDGRDDLAIALTALDGEGALIVAVHDAAGSASVATLDQQRRGRRALSLSIGDPGVYARTRLGRITPQRLLSPGETEWLDCPQSTVIISAPPGSARAYCSGRGGWRWVQIAD